VKSKKETTETWDCLSCGETYWIFPGSDPPRCICGNKLVLRIDGKKPDFYQLWSDEEREPNMSKRFTLICDMCNLIIEPEEHATVQIIRKFGLKPAGRPTAQQERTYDIHISCLQAAKVPIPSGEVKLEEGVGDATGPVHK